MHGHACVVGHFNPLIIVIFFYFKDNMIFMFPVWQPVEAAILKNNENNKIKRILKTPSYPNFRVPDARTFLL